jgi:hypothetical protein
MAPGKRPFLRRNDRGSALVIAVFVLAILTGTALALVLMGENELKLGRADLRGKQTFYVAEAGIEHARLALFNLNGKDDFDQELLDAAGGTVDGIELDLDNLLPTYDAAGILTGFSGGYGDDAPLLGATTFGEGAYVAFLTNDPVDGIDKTNDTNDRVMITAVGGTPNRSLETVQAIIEHDPLLPPSPKSSLTMIGPSPVYSPGNSSTKLYTGNDCNGTGVPGYHVPVVGVITDTAIPDVVDNMGKYDHNYESGTLAAEDTVANLNDTSHDAVLEPLDGRWQDCQQLHELIEYMRGKAKLLCTDGSACTLPAPSLDNFVFIDDDTTIGPHTGAGLLVVTGELTIHGDFDWDGQLLVVGEGSVRRTGGGGGTISGGILVADIAGPDDVYGNGDDCSTGFGSPEFDTSGGGNSTLSFCGQNLDAAAPQEVYRIVEFLQQ